MVDRLLGRSEDVLGFEVDNLEMRRESLILFGGQRGDKSILANESEAPAGMWLDNYAAKSIVVRNADVQGMRTGVSSPFFFRAGIARR